eukprot:IDg8078t1
MKSDGIVLNVNSSTSERTLEIPKQLSDSKVLPF